jgi:mannonate dehydratase
MEVTWRWFGPDDPVSLRKIRQAGAQSIVTALYHVAPGEVWPLHEVQARQRRIGAHGLSWSVAESLPVHPAIRLKEAGYERLVANYRASLQNFSTRSPPPSTSTG